MGLNKEEIIKALECCTRSGCSDNETKDCPLKPYEDCSTRLATDALAIIKAQDQKIFELENRIKENENGYAQTLFLEKCKNKDLVEKNERLKEKADRFRDNLKAVLEERNEVATDTNVGSK